MTALNFILSTMDPTINAGVMIANVHWYSTHKISGMVSCMLAGPTPAKNILSKPPINADKPVAPSFIAAVPNNPAVEKHIEYPHTNQIIVIMHVNAKHCPRTVIKFFLFTKPA